VVTREWWSTRRRDAPSILAQESHEALPGIGSQVKSRFYPKAEARKNSIPISRRNSKYLIYYNKYPFFPC
ncbi:hypothetical protein HAX54_014245, partial [Datura stramonium]|nr:hypothetical protein [Datura stramonium]